MSFSSTQIQFLQRLVVERPNRRAAGAVARYLSEHYSLGVVVGRYVDYHEEHIELAAALLKAHDLPVTALEGARRSDIAEFGGLSEKSLSLRPGAGSIAIKCIGACRLDGVDLRTPIGTHLVVTPEVAVRISCDRLMVVENLETFRNLEDYRWIDYRGMAVAAVFRGDPSNPLSDAAALIKERREPLWAFVDFDPAGLIIANSLPLTRLERLVLPAAGWLKQASETARGRELFDLQAERCGPAASSSEHPQIAAAWRLMTSLKSAVTQERMVGAVADISGG